MPGHHHERARLPDAAEGEIGEVQNAIWRVSRDMLRVADSAGRWLSVNPAWTTVLGWPSAAFPLDRVAGRRARAEHR